MRRNPKWTRDEVILTLDFYFRHYPSVPEKTSSEISDLSQQLRSLTDRLGLGDDFNKTYRNVNGVYMKLMNFHHLNGEHPGEGLKGGSKLDEKVFTEFENDKTRLRKIADSIKGWIQSDIILTDYDVDDDGDLQIQEGKLLTRIHRYRERDRKIILKKKEKALKEHGNLSCDCCGFDFSVA